MLWPTTRPRCFRFFAVTLFTLPTRQLRALSCDFAAESFSPLRSGTTHAFKSELLRIAVGLVAVVHAFSAEAWKTSAAPVSKRAAGAPRSAVAPSPESAGAVAPSSSPGLPPALGRVAAGTEVEVHAVSSATWKMKARPRARL